MLSTWPFEDGRGLLPCVTITESMMRGTTRARSEHSLTGTRAVSCEEHSINIELLTSVLASLPCSSHPALPVTEAAPEPVIIALETKGGHCLVSGVFPPPPHHSPLWQQMVRFLAATNRAKERPGCHCNEISDILKPRPALPPLHTLWLHRHNRGQCSFSAGPSTSLQCLLGPVQSEQSLNGLAL